MFETTSSPLDGVFQDHVNVRGEVFHESADLNSEITWNNLNQLQIPPTCFTVDTNNYLPPLVENMVQSCTSLDEWVESQQYSNFVLWDNIIEAQIGGGVEATILPSSSSSNMGLGTTLSSFLSAL
ncbi:hypothetical protein HRI_001924900 [Hibiscus trionum]|uniref:Uncharacterized protein n=1 Tax=Hibiscus trionum TaxID=183268 RepID=A0A9W7HSW9_HIBTR|nr:hypothetical protein HRI_001924900 [Hibiscus trionum]